MTLKQTASAVVYNVGAQVFAAAISKGHNGLFLTFRPTFRPRQLAILTFRPTFQPRQLDWGRPGQSASRSSCCPQSWPGGSRSASRSVEDLGLLLLDLDADALGFGLEVVLDAALGLGLVLGALGLGLMEIGLLVPGLAVLDAHGLGLGDGGPGLVTNFCK